MKAIIDIETGGFSKEKNGICEIGMLIIDDQYRVIGQYSALIKPYQRKNTQELVSYQDKAMAVHGITMDMLNDSGMNPYDVVECIEVLISMYGIDVFIGHSIDKFDKPWINYFFKMYTCMANQILNTEDTLTMAKELLPGLTSHSLPNLCKHFGITNHSSHRAMGDCMATLEVYKILKQI